MFNSLIQADNQQQQFRVFVAFMMTVLFKPIVGTNVTEIQQYNNKNIMALVFNLVFESVNSGLFLCDF